jgi:glycosyltransferase involved in cell wall biosynthesis
MRQRVNSTPHIEWRKALSETELRGLFARASVVALPYLATTGASSVVHRAAAWGRPLIVSDLPDFRAIAREEGLLMDYVPPADPPALAAAILGLLANPERQAALAQHNVQTMRAMSLHATGARYAELLLRAARQTV